MIMKKIYVTKDGEVIAVDVDANPSWVVDHDLWEEAKRQAGYNAPWGVVTNIYKSLGGRIYKKEDWRQHYATLPPKVKKTPPKVDAKIEYDDNFNYKFFMDDSDAVYNSKEALQVQDPEFDSIEKIWRDNWDEFEAFEAAFAKFFPNFRLFISSRRDGYYQEKTEHHYTIKSAVEKAMRLGARYAKYMTNTGKFEVPEEYRRGFYKRFGHIINQAIYCIVRDHILFYGDDYYERLVDCLESEKQDEG